MNSTCNFDYNYCRNTIPTHTVSKNGTDSNKLRCDMFRKDKIHMALLLSAAILCLAANGSATADDELLRQDLAGSASVVSEPPEYEIDVPIQQMETAADPEDAAAPDNTVPLYINGVLEGSCLVLDGTAQMTLARFASIASLSYDGQAIGGVTPTLSEDGDYAVLNGRYFYLPDGLHELGGEMYWPLTALAKMFGCTVTWDSVSGSIDLDVTNVALLTEGALYYNAQDVYWLSRIIYAESGNQPLEGQIAVGNVVLNRVNDERFPDSVYQVIFDSTYGVQFSPVETGSIYAQPDEESVVAAKLALDGYNTGGSALYFVNPSIGSTGWFNQTRTYVTQIGDHVFYA